MQTIPKRGLHCISASQWNYSKVGFGGYRLRTEQHQKALEYAIQKGVQVFDTSSHFEKGLSEEIMGRAIQRAIHKGAQRKNLFIISKAGFVYTPGVQQSSATVQIGPRTLHSADPTFLKKELNASLERMKLDHLDCFLVNNPERLCASSQRKITPFQVVDHLKTAFQALEECVKAGLIKSYGICSNSITVPSAPDHLPLQHLISPEFPHFRVVQYPLNVYEHDGIESVSPWAVKHDLVQITHRPLNVLVKGQVHTLRTRYSLETQATTSDVSKAIETLFTMESELATQLESLSLECPSKFVWADILSENVSKLLNNLFAASFYFKSKMKPQVQQDLAELMASVQQEALDPAHVEFVQEWQSRYHKQLDHVISTVLNVCQSRDAAHNQNVLQLVQSCLDPHERQSPGSDNLATLAVRCVASVPHIQTVLVGMHFQPYVDDALQAVQYPLSPDTVKRIISHPLIMN